MTADNKFAARLRELRRNGYPSEYAELLLDYADRLADLVEQVEAYREAVDAMGRARSDEGSRAEYVAACLTETNAYRAMLAAIDALAPEAGDAASGTESPPRMNGDAP